MSSTQTSPSFFVRKPVKVLMKALIVILFFLFTYFVISSLAVTTGPVLIDTSGSLQAGLSKPFEGKGGYAQGRHWIIYARSGSCEGSTTRCLFYATSTGGVTWTSTALNIRASNQGYGVYFNGTHIFIARYNQTVITSGNNNLVFGYGFVNSNGTITQFTQYQVKPKGGSTVTYIDEVVTVSTTFQVFIGYQRNDGVSSQLPYVIRSSGADYSIWTEDSQLASVSHDWRLALTPMTSGKVYAVYFITNKEFGRLWNNGWGTEEVASSSTANVPAAFLWNIGDTVYTLYYNTDPNPDTIEYNQRGTAWGVPEVAVSNIIDDIWTATCDRLNGLFYIFPYNYTANSIDGYIGKTQNWGTKTSIFTTTGANSSMAVASYLYSGNVNSTSYAVGVFWTENDNPLTNVEIKFGIDWSTGASSPNSSGPGHGGTGTPPPLGYIPTPQVAPEPFIALFGLVSVMVIIPHINRVRQKKGRFIRRF